MAKSRSGKGAKDANGVEEKIDIDALLRARMADFSPSEQSLASYILDNFQILPFETGSSIAQAVGVSEMTVTRFVRSLGFENLRDLKQRLRVAVTEKDSEVDDSMARFQMREGRQQVLQESLRLELDAIVKAYALTTTDVWDEAVNLLVKVRTIYVVGFQASKGLALDLQAGCCGPGPMSSSSTMPPGRSARSSMPIPSRVPSCWWIPPPMPHAASSWRKC